MNRNHDTHVQQPELEVPPAIARILRRLRRSIRSYVLLEGTAFVVALICILFWISLGLDWAHFQLRHLELPVWFRKAFIIGTAGLFLLSFTTWVFLRLVRSLRTKALALLLERRFPELDDRLITAVELPESLSGREEPLTRSMLNRTIEEVSRATDGLALGDLFDKARLFRVVAAALLLVASIGGLAWANEQALHRWSRAYVGWEDEYWIRETQLQVAVLVQPGDRIKRFKDMTYKHPRGSDLTLLVEVPEGKNVPDQITMDYQLATGRGNGRVLLTKVDERLFRHSFGSILDDVDFWVQGGDFINRRPYHVTSVAAPRIDQVVLKCDYPDYTGLDTLDENGTPVREVRRVQGTQISLPMETDFQLVATANKPLVSVRVQTERFELNLSQNQASVTFLSPDGEPQRSFPLPREPFIATSDDAPSQQSFQLPFLLTASSTALESESSPTFPLPIAADSTLRIYLEDQDEIISIEPARLILNGIADQPPTVETELRGIGTAITRKATIPIAGSISDDYGVTKARFHFRVDNDEKWRNRPLRNSPEGEPKRFQLARNKAQQFEQFEVLPLDLSIGQKLALTVHAEDGDNLNGPNASRGERYVFKIVSNEELLTLLYGRELNLRRRFEQIISEVQDTRKDLTLHRSRAEDADQLRESRPEPEKDSEQDSQLNTIDTAVSLSVGRALHRILKNHTEANVIEESFGEILEELVNNGVHTRQMVVRIDNLIVKPLGNINRTDFPRVDESISLCKLAIEKNQNPIPKIDASLDAIAIMLVHMKSVLAEMRDLVKFHEALKDLKLIIDAQQTLSEETKKERKKNLLNRLRILDP